MSTTRENHRSRSRDRKHEPQEDVREAVDQVDRDRAERVELWKRRYREYLDSQGDGRGDGRGKVPVTPFLLMRYGPTDMGARPMTSATRFWETPYIWVESSDKYGNAVAGEPNYLHALVFNGGAFQAAPVKVDFYWANPSLGLGAANMNYVGTEWVMIDRLSSQDVRCPTPWIPSVVNDGHECVMVNTTCTLADPILQPFQPMLDRHVGQKNLHVIAGHAGQKLVYTLQVNNLFPVAMPALITARFSQLLMTDRGHNIPLYQLGGLAATFDPRRTKPAQEATDLYERETHAHRITQRMASLERRARVDRSLAFQPLEGMGMSIAVQTRGARGMVQPAGVGTFASHLFASLDAFREIPTSGRQGMVIEELSLEAYAFQSIDVQVEIPVSAESGQIFVTHLANQAGPFTVGGYTIVAIIE